MSQVGHSDSPSGIITQCLKDWRSGDQEALSRLAQQVYSELRRLAAAVMAGQSGSHTIQPTELVHELYFQLPGVQEFDLQSRAQFLNVAAKMMRNILVDRARKRSAAKRGGDAVPITQDVRIADPAFKVDVLLVHQALERLSQVHPRQAHVVELRFFGGLTAEETFDVLKSTGVETSLRTVERDWTFAKAWLQNAIEPAPPL